MALYYLDASALVKRYVAEAGTNFVTRITNPSVSGKPWIATIVSVEVMAALYRRVNMGSLTTASARQAEQVFRNELYHLFDPIDLTPSILAGAMGLAKLHLQRAYDAVQLASAVHIHVTRRSLNLSPPILISADHALNQAALADGLLVDDPNRYP